MYYFIWIKERKTSKVDNEQKDTEIFFITQETQFRSPYKRKIRAKQKKFNILKVYTINVYVHVYVHTYKR